MGIYSTNDDGYIGTDSIESSVKIHMSQDDSRFDDSFLYELARNGDTAGLINHLKHGDKAIIRQRAAELLGDFSEVSRQFDKQEITYELINAVLEEQDDGVRARAIDSLFRHGRESLEELITEMAEFDARETPDWVTSKTLVEWLDEEYPEFRMVAAAALGELGDEHAVPYLVEAFEDLDPRVRERAVRACGTIGDERAVDALADRIEDNKPAVQRAAANALAAIGTERALEALIPAVRADDEQVRLIAVSELSQFEDTTPIVVLVRALEDDSKQVREAAVLSLVELSNAAPEEDDEVRRVVTRQLQEADSDDIIPQFLDILEESTRTQVRRRVLWLLGRVIEPDDVGIEEVYETLIDVLGDPRLSEYAENSLLKLQSDTLEKQLRIFVQGERGSSEATERAEALLERISTSEAAEVVRNSVNYTYVSDPADYTEKKENEG